MLGFNKAKQNCFSLGYSQCYLELVVLNCSFTGLIFRCSLSHLLWIHTQLSSPTFCWKKCKGISSRTGNGSLKRGKPKSQINPFSTCLLSQQTKVWMQQTENTALHAWTYLVWGLTVIKLSWQTLTLTRNVSVYTGSRQALAMLKPSGT